ncbi:hypothetical protein Halru_1208 [Halovivax ruber XH-70]|uniref:Uncharacterized protein n=1 Tax=Halovivax ruber (strain DSM 18193 / JCM 13892 / XH-70) TaxID=797302 RepID=L0IAJ7_HALRX|nr:hypothetical protein [Halovivax ruber]AGB15823.1 hypothetical protein Halru_1208 [Halovivax ruber XH-70]
MATEPTWTRRTVCQGLAIAAGTLVPTTVVRGAANRHGDHNDQNRPSASDDQTKPTDPEERFAVYPGVVDRIVDDTWVVILLESDGRVVDEIVERREKLPPLAEGERVIVVLDDGDTRCVLPTSGSDG